MILTFTEFIEPKQSAAGRMMPARAKASDGKTYTLPKKQEVQDLIRYSLGSPLDCETKTEQNGKYTNHFIFSAEHHVPLPTPVAAGDVTGAAGKQLSDAPAVSPVSVEKSAPRAFVPDEDKQRLIVRQSSLRAAVDFLGHQPPECGLNPEAALLDTAEKFVRWVYGGEAYDLAAEVNRDGEADQGTSNTHKATSASSSPAQQHLAEARAKAKSITDSYDDSDAVCPSCGRREFLKQWTGGWFCAKSKVAGEPGGCGYPARGERLDAPVTWGEFKERSAIRRPDAQVVSPRTHPSLSR